MLCQRCKKNIATARYAEVVDGHVTEVHVCSECLVEIQNNPKGFNISSTEPQIRIPSKEEKQEQLEKPKRKQFCSVCGLQLSYIQEKQKVGCFSCYKNFGSEIEAIIEVIQGGGVHIGKKLTYPNEDERIQTQVLLDAKKALIRQAIKVEDYEFAAKLRDEIKDLEKLLTSWKMGNN